MFIPAALLVLTAPDLLAASAGGGRSSGTFAGVGGQGNGQGGAGGGYALAWNGAARPINGQGSNGTDNGYMGNGASNGLQGQGSQAAVQINSNFDLSAATYIAPTAGAGGDATGAFGGGGGGGGGAAAALSNDALDVTSRATLIGGQGGNGGDGGGSNLGGGGGGGGAGLYAGTSNSRLDISDSVTGGNGGDGGNFAGGGGGGDGIFLVGGGTAIRNNATVSGGIGGGHGSGNSSTAQAGESGVGVRINGNRNTLINDASIRGGLNNDGLGNANAVQIAGNDNAVQLLGGSSFLGDVVVESGTGNRLIIGDSAGSTFDLSSLVRNLGTAYGGTRFAGFDTLEKTGGSTWVLEGSNSYTGTTRINEGGLIVGAAAGSSTSLRSNVSVASGAMLGGHGQITGNVDLLAGSNLNPGNSIGTLNVIGNVTFNPASTLDIETYPDGTADKLIATGTVALNDATLNVIASNGTWLPATRYTIIEAGSVTGQFAQVTRNLPFLTPTVTYNPNNVVLTLNRNATRFSSLGETPNQVEAARAVDGLAPSQPVAVAISTLDAETARSAYDSLSGEIHASAQSALLDESRYLREGINSRMLAAQGLTTTQGSLNDDDDNLVFWLQGYGAQATTDGDGNGARFGRDSQGVIFGGDLIIDEQWRLGSALSLGNSEIDDARRSSMDIDSRSLALFASGRVNQLNVRFGASRSWHDIDSRRQVDIGTLADRNRASYRATTDQAFAELGYRLSLDTLQLEPFAGLTQVRFKAEAFRERGGETALQSRGERQDATISSVGLRVSQPLARVAGLPISAKGNLTWQHAFGQKNARSDLSFAGGNQYQVEGAEQTRDSALLEAGVAVELNRHTTLDFNYSGRFSKDLHDDSLRLGLSVGI